MGTINDVLNQIWRFRQPQADRLGYELVILAVPKTPGQIEAVSSFDLGTVGDLLAAFARAKEGPHELEAIEPGAGSAPEAPAAEQPVAGARQAGIPANDVGEGWDRGRSSQGGADAPAEAREGDAAADAVVIRDGKVYVKAGTLVTDELVTALVAALTMTQ